MSWGLPPKYKSVFEIKNASVAIINQSVVNGLMNKDFALENNSTYCIEASKKMSITFLSFFLWSKPRIRLVVLITKTGRLTINSTYTYNSMFGIAMNDAGKQKKEITPLLDEIKDLVKLNIEFERHGTVDGKRIV